LGLVKLIVKSALHQVFERDNVVDGIDRERESQSIWSRIHPMIELDILSSKLRLDSIADDTVTIYFFA
jgi:hypothetical protein